MVLDDATSAVDPEVEARILSALREQDSDATLVVVAEHFEHPACDPADIDDDIDGDIDSLDELAGEGTR
jgi:ABC-type uncharacterized transport system fused permease/ATPase subunit